MLTIGITGGIAGGKTTVARLLEAKGARVIDADRVAHETYEPGTPGYEAVVQTFGPSILAPNGIDRRTLGRIVFTDPAQMARLTAIVWPLVAERLMALKRDAEAQGVDVLAIEAAVLREAGWDALVDAVWLVRAPIEVVRARLEERGLSTGDAAARLAAQQATTTDHARVDTVIDNDGDLEALAAKVEAALKAVLQRRRE